MRFLDEHRRRPALLADHLPWAAMVAPGVVLNKDGSFTCGLRFRGPDLESASDLELMSVRARLNNALKRLGSGWCLHVEARRRSAQAYPKSDFEIAAAWLVDAERRSLFETSEPAYETDYRAALTWLPPADRTRRVERVLFDGAEPASRDWRTALDAFERETAQVVDLLADALPEVAMLDDGQILTWLHDCVSPRSVQLELPATPMFLDAWLADAPLLGGVAPTLDGQALKVVSVRGLPATTRPGLLDALGALPFPYRWSARWIGLDKTDAETELVKLRKRWFAKRKGVGVLLREAITREEVPLLDTDAAAKTDECDGALEALGSDACAYGYLTTTITVTAPDPERAAEQARAVEAALNAQGFVARTEDLNAVEAWLGSLPGEPYADVRRPLLSTLNLADLLPVSAVWAGPAADPRLQGPPLAVARTSGSTPFRLALHVGDVGHAMVVGPTGSGKSALLAFLALQWFRYQPATVTVTNKVSTGGGVAMAGNVLVGGIIGAGIDAGTGAMLDLTPNPAHVDLSQERAPATGRPE